MGARRIPKIEVRAARLVVFNPTYGQASLGQDVVFRGDSVCVNNQARRRCRDSPGPSPFGIGKAQKDSDRKTHNHNIEPTPQLSSL